MRVIVWSSWMLMFPGILSVYFSNPLFISPKALMTTGIFVVFIPHILLISISRFCVSTFFQLLWQGWYGHIYDEDAFLCCLVLMTMSGLLALSRCRTVWWACLIRWLSRYFQWLCRADIRTIVICLDLIFSADSPVQVGFCFIVPLDVLVRSGLKRCGRWTPRVFHSSYIVSLCYLWWFDGAKMSLPDSGLVQLGSGLLSQLSVHGPWAICSSLLDLRLRLWSA